MQYPTPKSHGIPRGSIKLEEKDKRYRVSIKHATKDTYDYFDFTDEESKKKAFEDAKICQMKNSDSCGLTRNKLRFLSKDVIEVDLTKDKVMITNAKFIDKVNLYPLQAKREKSTKNLYGKYYAKNTFHVMYQNKKNPPQFFTDLIYNHKILNYINGNFWTQDFGNSTDGVHPLLN